MKKIHKNHPNFVYSFHNNSAKNNNLLSLLTTILKIIPKINLAEIEKFQPNNKTTIKKLNNISENQKYAISYLENHQKRLNEIKTKNL